MQVIVDSLLTQYEQSGAGTRTILLLHGWGDDHRTFTHLQKSLSKHHKVVSLDLPGFGASQAPGSVWNLDDYAKFVNHFLQKLGLKSVAIIAHSNGAAVAIRGLAQNELGAEKLVVLGGAGIRDRQKGKKLALKVVAKTGKVATFWLPKRHKQKLQKMLYGAAGSDMLVAPHLQETFKKTVAQDVQADAKKLTVPVLLVYGENDRATPVLYGRIFEQLISHATLEVVGGAEHFVHHDKPEQVEKLIEEFLR